MFYQGRAMSALSVIAIIAEKQGYNIWEYDHKDKGKNFHNLVKFFLDFTENNEIISIYLSRTFHWQFFIFSKCRQSRGVLSF